MPRSTSQETAVSIHGIYTQCIEHSHILYIINVWMIVDTSWTYCTMSVDPGPDLASMRVCEFKMFLEVKNVTNSNETKPNLLKMCKDTHSIGL